MWFAAAAVHQSPRRRGTPRGHRDADADGDTDADGMPLTDLFLGTYVGNRRKRNRDSVIEYYRLVVSFRS